MLWKLTLWHVSASCGSPGGLYMLVHFLPPWPEPKFSAHKALCSILAAGAATAPCSACFLHGHSQETDFRGLITSATQPQSKSSQTEATGLPSACWLGFIHPSLGTQRWLLLNWSSAFLCCVAWDQQQFLHMLTGTCLSSLPF